MHVAPRPIITAVTGDVGSGKSTFIRALGAATNYKGLLPGGLTRELHKTGIIEIGVIPVDATAVLYLLEMPAFSRSDGIWYTLASFIDSYVVVVDSTRPETCPKARQVIDFFDDAAADAPRLVAANKQDVEGCLSPEQVAYILALDGADRIPVLPCCATKRDDVKKVLLTLFDRIANASATG